ncbi:hypothetical protein [Microbacterium sp. AR7-10]|uniref:hypothetical protein n=1 Tax=Microbacterium sp. AR7-10 TaxID=1891970 RepID=UPI0008FC84D0|nr:hypothetical protein [Microbacterium sp. AR7-10]OIU86626.1 hypothetical protein BFN01_10940 [Microbacterium sp. AR7-10]
MRIVIFSPSGSYGPESLPTLTDADEVIVVSWTGTSALSDERIMVPQRTFGARISAATRGNVMLRTLVRVLPTDSGARFWRATRRDPRVRDAVRRADLIVAPERDGGFAAWSWRRVAERRGREIPAVSGYPAARTAIGQLR